MADFSLTWKFFKRELQRGDLTLLFMAIFIAISSLSSIGFVLKRIDHSMLNHAAQLNGAELILKSPRAIALAWQKKAISLGLKQANMVSFPSMLVVNDQFKLAQIKAVSDNFPLLGKLMIKSSLEQKPEQGFAPLIGHIYLDRRLYHFFKQAKKSKTNKLKIELGDAGFSPSGLLESVPGQSSSFFNIAPMAMINLADLDKTATIQIGSRADYLYYFSGKEKTLKQYHKWLKNNISAGQNIRYGVEGMRVVNSNLKKANKFLSLAALLTVLLSAIAIIISRYHYGQKQAKNNAVLLCLGVTENRIIKIELIKLILLAFFASTVGIIFGYAIHLLLLELLSELIPKPLSELSWLPVWMGMGSGILLILSLSLSNLISLKKLSPMMILRKDTMPVSVNHYTLYVMGVLGLFILSWIYTGDITLSLLFYMLIFTALLVLYVCARLLLKALLLFNHYYKFMPALTIINLRQHQFMALLQISTFALIFALVLIIYLSRTDLLFQWQQQLPANAPNHFVINIQPDETGEFKKMLHSHHLDASELFPMIRGRLSSLNDRPIKEALPEDKRNHNALNRELNLSFAATMQVHNRLIKGQWWSKKTSSIAEFPEISLESSLAEDLGIEPGDKLGFQIGAQKIYGVVKNLRAVKWDSFQPNFYVIFPPHILEAFPLTYISSFHLKQQDKLLLNQMIAEFPGITIIEVDQILKEVQYIIEKIALAINFVFVFILIAALLVFASSLSSTLEGRMLENAIIRTLGASTKTLRYSLLWELSIIAIFSALMGLIIAEGISAVLYIQVFNLNYSFHPLLWFFTPIIAILLICGVGILLMNKIFTRSVNDSLKAFTA